MATSMRLLFGPSRPILNPRRSRLPSLSATPHVPDYGRRRCLRLSRPPHAFISAPAPGPEAYQSPSLDAAEAVADVAAAISSTDAVTWAGVWALLSQHKARLVISLAALLACTTCTLSMPLFSGRFFETLIGRGSEPLTGLLSKIAVLYTTGAYIYHHLCDQHDGDLGESDGETEEPDISEDSDPKDGIL